MHWRTISTAGIAGAVLALALGLGAMPAQSAPAGAPLLQPSPRPTLVPTATARPTRGPEEEAPPVVSEGRITGTVIDLTTGAPAGGVTVDVGGRLVSSDAFGNYDHWLPAGSYNVALSLGQNQGTPEQPLHTVEINPDGTTVLHLNFRSPLLPTAAPTEAPAAPAEAAPAPATAVPSTAPAKPAVVAARKPERLPVTGDTPENSAAPWISLALALLTGGVLLSLRPVRMALLPAGLNARYDDGTALLGALLTASPRKARRRPARRDDDALLKSLLDDR